MAVQSRKARKRAFMETQNVFTYRYSAKENDEIERIRRRYLPKEERKLDALRRLDARVNRPANVFAYTFGSISAVVMGAGMSLVMTNIGATLGIASALVPGIVIGVVGLGMALLTYPMYKGILNARKKKYGAEILTLSEQVMNKSINNVSEA